MRSDISRRCRSYERGVIRLSLRGGHRRRGEITISNVNSCEETYEHASCDNRKVLLAFSHQTQGLAQGITGMVDTTLGCGCASWRVAWMGSVSACAPRIYERVLETTHDGRARPRSRCSIASQESSAGVSIIYHYDGRRCSHLEHVAIVGGKSTHPQGERTVTTGGVHSDRKSRSEPKVRVTGWANASHRTK